MVIEISKTSIRANIYKNFYDLINAISDLNGRVYPKYSDKVRNSKNDYPAVIIYPANTPSNRLTAKKNNINGTILIEVFATNDKDADHYSDLIDNKIDENKHLLSRNNLRLIELEDESDSDDMRGQIRGFIKRLTYSFQFYYVAGGGY